MKELFSQLKNIYFGEEIEFQLKIFNLISISGILISAFAIFILTILQKMNINIWFFTVFTNIICPFLLSYFIKNKLYIFCYIIDIFAIFSNLFLWIFLSDNVYGGLIPSFFVLAILLTIHFFRNTDKTYMALLGQTIIYVIISLFTYLFVKNFSDIQIRESLLLNIIIGFVISSLVFTFIMYIQFQIYKKDKDDLNEEKAQSDAENKAKSRFLANISHEIRTPLNIIMGTNDLIQRDTSSQHIKQLSSRVSHAVLNLQEIISNILEVSKIESGITEMINEKYSTDELISHLEIIGREFTSSDVNFYMKISEKLPKYLIGNVIAIKKIVGNFLSNAFKYTEKGHVVLYISSRTIPKQNKIILSIEVSDTGLGISPEHLPNIFDIFNRADITTRKNIEGTGLGLAIVKELSDSIGAQTSVESVYNIGSTFRIDIPQEIAEEETADIDKSHIFLAPQVKILAVDDNKDNLIILEEMLKPTEMQVDTVLSGLECLEITSKKDYHIILMDFIMPDINGIELLGKLKERPDFKTPVIALTANAISGSENLLLSSGFSSYLSKPYTMSNLYKIIIPYIPSILLKNSSREKNNFSNFKANNQILKFTLLEYGLDLDMALEYFDNDILKLRQIAMLLSKSYENERAELKKNQEQYPENLKYQVHSIKSRAKNVGLIRLSNIATEIETLCINGNVDEAITMLPHLFYLWDSGKKALELFIESTNNIPNLNEEQQKKDLNENSDIFLLYKNLINSLKDMNRKPALNTLEILLETEQDKENISHLRNSIICVLEFDFKKAQYIIENLYTMKEMRD